MVIEPDVFSDQRGFFFESYNEAKYVKASVGKPFVQDNYSRSMKNVLRGLHLQRNYPQGKLIRVASGCIFDVAVDINPQSPTFRQWYATELSEDNFRQIYVAPGYAHGFMVLSDVADVEYKCTDYYNPADEIGIIWNDPDLSIKWPLVGDPVLSTKDAAHPSLSEYLSNL